MTDLNFLPCMCCGSNRIIHFKTSKNRGYATCIDCGMRTRGCGNYENKDELKWKDRATILWNRRTPMDNIVEKLEEKHIDISGNTSLHYLYSEGYIDALDYVSDIVKQEINNGME